MSSLTFPPNFSWGAATAAHQVEGHNSNDWWDWEQTPGHIKHNDSSLVACDWWNGRYREDFAHAQALGHNAHRLSVEWSRIEPREGAYDAQALRFYREVLTTARACGLTPLVTLHHFTNPRWVAENGGWVNPSIVRQFEKYVARVITELGDLADFWITINEPIVYAHSSYLAGGWPPGEKNFNKAIRVVANMVRAHAAAYHAIKRIQPHSKIGLANHIRLFLPNQSWSPLDRLVALIQDFLFNHIFQTPLYNGRFLFPPLYGDAIPKARGTQDFIGVNYYFTWRVAFDLHRPSEIFGRAVLNPWAKAWQKKLDWFGLGNPNAQSLYLILRNLGRHGLPVYITENGILDAGQDTQTRYLISHLGAVARAIREGTPVKGYFWWTLVDNFEWAEGYNLPFGLLRLDLESRQRTPRPVAEIYARIIRENEIGDDLLKRYPEL